MMQLKQEGEEKKKRRGREEQGKETRPISGQEQAAASSSQICTGAGQINEAAKRPAPGRHTNPLSNEIYSKWNLGHYSEAFS